VYVRGQSIWLVKRAHADEPNGITGAGIVTPYSDTAGGTPENPLPFATVGWCVHDLRRATLKHDTVGLNHRVLGKR
jgi:hypothetical protein